MSTALSTLPQIYHDLAKPRVLEHCSAKIIRGMRGYFRVQNSTTVDDRRELVKLIMQKHAPLGGLEKKKLQKKKIVQRFTANLEAEKREWGAAVVQRCFRRHKAQISEACGFTGMGSLGPRNRGRSVALALVCSGELELLKMMVWSIEGSNSGKGNVSSTSPKHNQQRRRRSKGSNSDNRDRSPKTVLDVPGTRLLPPNSPKYKLKRRRDQQRRRQQEVSTAQKTVRICPTYLAAALLTRNKQENPGCRGICPFSHPNVSKLWTGALVNKCCTNLAYASEKEATKFELSLIGRLFWEAVSRHAKK